MSEPTTEQQPNPEVPEEKTPSVAPESTEEKKDSPENPDAPAEEKKDAEPKDKEAEATDLEKLRASFQEKAKTYLIEQSRHVVIPSFSKWFDMNSVHNIEKKLFPDFFPPKTSEDTPQSVYKTPEVYRNMRDFMINSYRINPIEYLTITAVRRNLAGDVASIIRIHRFLEKWGLINYQIDPRTKPNLVGPQFTGHFQVTLDTPLGLTPFVPENIKIKAPEPSLHEAQPEANNVAEKSAQPEPVKTESVEKIPLNLEVTKNIFDEDAQTKGANSVLYFCNETSNDVSKVRYHNLKNKGAGSLGPLVISKEVYEQGLFPLNFVASDFVKLEEGIKQSEWTEQEVLLLLEGIEMYATTDNNGQTLFINNNGQWDKISEHVSTKSRDDCLVKFLQLPIEERYLEKILEPKEEEAEIEKKGFDKDTVIQEVAQKLIESEQGKKLIGENSKQNLQQTVLDQTNLINQVIELTLEKFDAKMKLINHLEADLIKTENLLNLQRKQALIERWLNFEKVAKFRKENKNPELDPLLAELLTPININEINKSFNKIDLDGKKDAADMDVDKPEEKPEEALPVSVTQPKSYQFWSA